MNTHKIALAGAAAALAVGGSLAFAPSASAATATTTVGSSACNDDLTHRSATITASDVRMHSAPLFLEGEKPEPTLRLLQKGAKVEVYCMYITEGTPIFPEGWVYLRHDASGWKGWVWSDYISGQF